MDFSTGWACVSHASDVLGMCAMITSTLLCTETERWREEQRLSSSGVFIGGFLGRLGMTSLYGLDIVTDRICHKVLRTYFIELSPFPPAIILVIGPRGN
jgi:hypothetical protein